MFALGLLWQYILAVQSEILSLRISKAESRALRERARKDGISRGTVVRKALRAYGVIPEPDPEKSDYDVIKHIIERCQCGPADLSTNARHLSDYGR
jgi:hypothetical protein